MHLSFVHNIVSQIALAFVLSTRYFDDLAQIRLAQFCNIACLHAAG